MVALQGHQLAKLCKRAPRVLLLLCLLTGGAQVHATNCYTLGKCGSFVCDGSCTDNFVCACTSDCGSYGDCCDGWSVNVCPPSCKNNCFSGTDFGIGNSNGVLTLSGDSGGGCYCDPTCLLYGNCCDDFLEECCFSQAIDACNQSDATDPDAAFCPPYLQACPSDSPSFAPNGPSVGGRNTDIQAHTIALMVSCIETHLLSRQSHYV